MQHNRRRPALQNRTPLVQAVTTDGRVVSVPAADLHVPSGVQNSAGQHSAGQHSPTQRILLHTDLGRSARATLAFRGLLLVAIAVAFVTIWT